MGLVVKRLTGVLVAVVIGLGVSGVGAVSAEAAPRPAASNFSSNF